MENGLINLPTSPFLWTDQNQDEIRSTFLLWKKTDQCLFWHEQNMYPGRGLAVNFRKKCDEMRWKKNNFHRVFLTSFCGECGESRWIIFFHRVLSILTKKNRPYTGSNLCPPACLPMLIPLRQLSLTCLLFLVNLNQIE